MKISKKRLIAGIAAITCCCSTCNVFPASTTGESSLIAGMTVNAAGSTSTTTKPTSSATTSTSTTTKPTGSATTPTEPSGEGDVSNEDVTVTQEVNIEVLETIEDLNGNAVDVTWTSSSGYTYALAKITETNIPSTAEAGDSVNADVKYAIAVTGYVGSSVTVSGCNDAEMPSAVHKLVEDLELSFIDYTKSTVVAKDAFRDMSAIEGVGLSGVQYLDDSCFYGCSALDAVELPDSIKYVGKSVFASSGLRKLIVGYKMSEVPDNICSGCSGFDTIKFKYPEAVREIGYAAFERTALSSYPLKDIGHSVKISQNAFSGCKSLKELELGDSVDAVYRGAFAGCENLISIDIGSGTRYLGESCFSGCTALTSVTLNNSLTTILDEAFAGCSSLVEFPKLPETIVDMEKTDTAVPFKGLGTGVFNKCTKLKSFELPDSITIVPDSFFYGCSSMTSVTLGTGINTIGNSAFTDCNALKTVVHDNVIDHIGDFAFQNCRSLDNIITNKCKTIGKWAYYGCTGLKNINIDADTCEDGAFQNCSGIIKATLGKSIASNLPTNMFCGCTSLEGFENTDFSDVQVISESAFRYCTSLKEVNFPAADKILPSAFENCTSLERICAGDTLNVRDYGDNCLKGCTSLTQKIDSTVVVIGVESFADSSISSAIIRGDLDKSLVIKDNAFKGCEQLTFARIQLDDSILSTYSQGKGVFKDCTALADVDFQGTEFAEEMFSGCTNLLNVKAKKVTKVGKKSFAGCTSFEGFERGYTHEFAEIGEYAFEDCKSLKDSYSSVETQPSVGAFKGCESLVSVSILGLRPHIFEGCINLSDVELAAGTVSYIHEFAFKDCKKITSLDFVADGVVSYGESCFEGSGLKGDFLLSDSRTTVAIAKRAFADCKGITSVDLECGVIGEEAFQGCTGIQTATIRANEIAPYAFEGCGGLYKVTFEDAHYPQGLGKIGEGAFLNCGLLREVVMDELASIGSQGMPGLGGACDIGDKAFGFVGASPLNNFLIVGRTKILMEDAGMYTYATKNGLMFQDVETYDAEAREAEKKIAGDLNLDGYVNVTDLVILQKWLTKQEVSMYGLNADVNEDESVNVFDDIALRRIILADIDTVE